jgi:hypothetical protein
MAARQRALPTIATLNAPYVAPVVAPRAVSPVNHGMRAVQPAPIKTGIQARAAGNVPWYRLNQKLGSAVGLAPAIHKNPAKHFVFEALQLIASEKATAYPRAYELLLEARNYLQTRTAVLDQRNQAFKLMCQAYIPAVELMKERFRPADEMAAMDPPTTDEKGNKLSEDEQLAEAQAALDLPMRRILMEAMGFIDMNKWANAEFSKQIRIGHERTMPWGKSEMEEIGAALTAANKVVLRFYVDRVETLPYELASERAEARGELSLADMVTGFLKSQGRNMPANVYSNADPRNALARAAAERAAQEAEASAASAAASAAASRRVDPMGQYRQRPAAKARSGLYAKTSPTAYSGLGLGPEGPYAPLLGSPPAAASPSGAASSGNPRAPSPAWVLPRSAAAGIAAADASSRGGKKTKKSRSSKKRSTRRN